MEPKVIGSPKLLRDLFLPNPSQRIQPWLNDRKSGLAAVGFLPNPALCRIVTAPNIQHSAAMWIKRCADVFQVDPRLGLVVLEAEQGLATDTTVRSPAYSTRLLQGSPVRPFPQGKDYIMSRQGWLEIIGGDEKMVKACGAGWLEDMARPSWDMNNFIGFDHQVYQCFKILSRHYREWTPEKLIVLHKGVLARCADPAAYAILQYTPYEGEVNSRGSIAQRLFA